MMKPRGTQIFPLALGVVIGLAIGWASSPSHTATSAPVAADSAPATPAAGDGEGAAAKSPKRFGAVIGVKPEKLDEYVKLHAETWPGVLKTIRDCNIRNYSIYLGKLDDGKQYLFAYYEYTGDDFAADMKKMGDDPVTQDWWKVTDPCQIPQKNRKPGEHWMTMREVFHTD